jgi:2-iminobutanoate/2-iminopropanoate deaminase
MSLDALNSPDLAPPVGPFSHAARFGGVLYLSGQVGQDPATGRVVSGGTEAEVRQILANLAAVLKAAGSGFDRVLRVGVFLTDMADFAVVNQAYAQHFHAPYPARTTVAVAALPLGARVELDLIAACPDA